jgi:phenylalanyl-tRNA synthetase beta chain
MKISLNWLKEYIDCDVSTEDVVTYLTNTGLEVGGVETVEAVKGGLQGLVVGEVLGCEQHPNADRLKKTRVSVGGNEVLDIVCGAPNVALGQKVIVAVPGTMLYPTRGEPFKIKKGRIRGQASNGMICAEDEIGLGEGHEGIAILDAKAVPGTPLSELLKLKSDEVLEIDLTPNRSDAVSHLGVARDLLAVLKADGKLEANSTLKWPDVTNFVVDERSSSISIKVEDIEACPRYAGVVIRNVKVADSPDWLQQRLRAIGLNPINNVVDITNFVLHEMGQPLHAFDADKIEGNQVVVRKLNEQSKFYTLDEVERTLSANDLMICNSREGMCIAGVFGGLNSGVTTKTSTLFLESAYFSPVGIRKTARRHGLSTDASFRYERGADPEIAVYALKRAAMLIKEIAGGIIASDVLDNYPNPIQPAQVKFNYSNCDRLIGQVLERETIKEILTSLDITIRKEDKGGLLLTVPLYRSDVLREVDVIEEVLRIYGYNNIALPTAVRSSLSSGAGLGREKIQQKVADLLSASGFAEVMTNSLTKSDYYPANMEESKVAILNPLSSELNVMRQQLHFGLLEVSRYNYNRKNTDLKLYEFGKTYSRTEEGYTEKRRLGLMLLGRSHTEGWDTTAEKVDFFEVKKAVYKVLERLGIPLEKIRATAVQDKTYDYGMAYQLNEKEVVVLGKLSKKTCKKVEVDVPVFYAGLDWDALLQLTTKKKIAFTPVPKYPAVRRDLALLLDETVRFEQLEQIALQTDKRLLQHVGLFDVYKGKDLEKGKQSYAMSFTFRSDEKTLKDAQVDQSIKRIYEAIKSATGAVLRKGEI